MRTVVLAVGGVAASVFTGAPLAAADADAGRDVFRKKCASCHTAEAGKHKTGPSLFGVYARKAGSTDFPRYRGLANVDFTWDDAKLDAYIKDPKAFTEAHTGNKVTAMSFRLADAQERADVIAYLKTLK